MNELEHFLPVQSELGEGPMWSVEEQALYWVDIAGGCFYRCVVAARTVEKTDVGQPVGTIVLRQSGGYVLATRDGIGFWENGAFRLIHRPEMGKPGSRFNDGAVDRQGRFWAGTVAEDGTGGLYRFDPDGSLHLMETGIGVSNGIGWSLDNKTMYYTDSPRRVIYAYDFDVATGNIANRRIWVRTPEPEVPDGLTVDTEGFIWSAKWDGWRVTRYDPSGKIERDIKMPVQRVTSVMFGGRDLDELYITSAWIGIADRATQPQAGDIFRLRPGVRGLPEPKFAG